MYTKQEASLLRKEFWTVFGQYMRPVLSNEGEKVNWLNYRTHLKDVYFKLETTNKDALVSIEIAHNDADIQQLFYEQFLQMRGMFENVVGNWKWVLHGNDNNGKVISKIYDQLEGVSILNKNDWPALISFFKPRIIALDQFWSEAKYAFEALQ